MSTILGTKELELTLEQLQHPNLKKALLQSTTVVRDTARNYCPVNHTELKRSIGMEAKVESDHFRGIVFTNKEYAPYVEFGTGPVGQAMHRGISPDVNPTYTQDSWWIHESQIDKADAEKYHFFKIETEDGVFYMTDGQAANPFMYPALVDSEEIIEDIFEEEVFRTI